MHSQSSFDRWLGRVGSFAQILVCAFTAWAIFYTVVPLYKVALLEESIARREIELSEKSEELEAVKDLLHDMGQQIYAKERKELMHNVIHAMAGECTNFSYFISEVYFDRRFDPYDALMGTDYSKCFLRVLNNGEAKSALRESDFSYVGEQLKILGSVFDELRVQALDDMKTLESRARKDPSILSPKSKGLKRFDSFVQDLGMPKPPANEEFEFAVDSTRLDIFTKHDTYVRDRLYDFRSIEWPEG